MLQTTLAPVNSSVSSPAFLADLEDLMLHGLDSQNRTICGRLTL